MSESESSVGNPFAPPRAHVEDAASEAGTLAGRGARFVGALIDGVFCALVMFVVGLAASVNLFGAQVVDGAAYYVAYAASLVVYTFVQAVPLHLRGQTIGKMVMRLRTCRRDGSRASVVRLVGVRLVPMMLVGLIPIGGPFVSLIDCLMIFRESRRCLHDEIANTIVVRA
jgi:uncharacterized RDD family membrane protein YckC